MSRISIPPSRPTNDYWKDLGERVLATSVQAGVSFAIVEVQDIELFWIPILTTVLSVVKGGAARFLGNSEDAALTTSRV